eukprot:GILK01003059.1.p1 GENE.GILK01003059.1~~GILK01003059.1.p1  ORF type:complete len:325 (+),score=52.20 GILK01003059.1:42-977(+)
MATASSKEELQLILLPYRVRMVRIPKENVNMCIQALLSIFFASREQRFFSYTESPVEISLVVDEEDLKMLPKDLVDISEVVWRVSHYMEGPSVGAVYRLTTPLAAAAISVCYVSTFLTDFVIVPSEKLSAAVTALRSAFNLKLEGDADEVAALTSEHVGLSEEVTAPLPPHKHPLHVVQSTAFVARIEKNEVKTQAHALLHAFFLPQSNDRLVSFTWTDDEVSLILDEQSLNQFTESSLVRSPGSWRPIAVGDDPLGFDETGIVCSQAEPLFQAHIPLFYLSTFSTDYTLVMQADLDRALEVLKTKFTVRL